MRPILLLAFAFVIEGCGSNQQKATVAPKPESAKPAITDESRRFPKANLKGTRVAEIVFGKDLLPGGTVAEYSSGKREWSMFVVQTASPSDAAIGLLNWKKALSDAELVPSFGGYYGTEGGTPMFVFTKGKWVAGVAGLKKSEADAQARLLAARLD